MLGSHGSPRTPDIKASIAEKPRVAVLIGDPSSEVLSALRNDAWTLVPCEDGQALLETVVERLPSAIVVEFTPTAGSLAILNLIRRAAPRVPLILVAGGGNLDLLVDLNGVAVDDLAVEGERDLNPERALA